MLFSPCRAVLLFLPSPILLVLEERVGDYKWKESIIGREGGWQGRGRKEEDFVLTVNVRCSFIL